MSPENTEQGPSLQWSDQRRTWLMAEIDRLGLIQEGRMDELDVPEVLCLIGVALVDIAVTLDGVRAAVEDVNDRLEGRR
jgi:hypothetical protein